MHKFLLIHVPLIWAPTIISVLETLFADVQAVVPLSMVMGSQQVNGICPL